MSSLLGEDLVLPPAICLVVGLRVKVGLRELGFGFKVGLCVASAELNWGS